MTLFILPLSASDSHHGWTNTGAANPVAAYPPEVAWLLQQPRTRGPSGRNGGKMTWTIDSATDLDVIVKAGPPPNDGNVLVTDFTWSSILVMWAKYKKASGDQQPLSLVQLHSCVV
jgi:hypothetical protein